MNTGASCANAKLSFRAISCKRGAKFAGAPRGMMRLRNDGSKIWKKGEGVFVGLKGVKRSVRKGEVPLRELPDWPMTAKDEGAVNCKSRC